ncbi:hypothetical protein Droror1_Dr00012083 [Drosera rotundifolia]
MVSEAAPAPLLNRTHQRRSSTAQYTSFRMGLETMMCFRTTVKTSLYTAKQFLDPTTKRKGKSGKEKKGGEVRLSVEFGRGIISERKASIREEEEGEDDVVVVVVRKEERVRETVEEEEEEGEESVSSEQTIIPWYELEPPSLFDGFEP